MHETLFAETLRGVLTGMESCPGGFRARLKKGDRTFNGRETEAAAQEDQKQYKTAVAEALDKLQEVHQTLHGLGFGAVMSACETEQKRLQRAGIFDKLQEVYEALHGLGNSFKA